MYNQLDKEINQLRKFFLVFFFGFILVLGGSLIWNLEKLHLSSHEYALAEAKASFKNDLLYRRWASMHSGIYVPITDSTPPNEYLSFIDGRDIVTDKGQKLTLINPAYMTRQASEMIDDVSDIKRHLTSLNPIRPENKADSWEANALRRFEKGAKDYSSIEVISGIEYLRYMKPFLVEQSCINCHGHQGYKLGDVRGGISVSVPLANYNQIAKAQEGRFILIHLVIMAFVMALLVYSYKLFLSELKKRYQLLNQLTEAKKHLTKQNNKVRALNKGYRMKNKELMLSKEKAQESDRLKTAFFNNLSHEIRTPLNGIVGFASLLCKGNETSSNNELYTSYILENSDRLEHVMNGVIELSQLTSGTYKIKPQIINIKEVASNIISENTLMLNKRNLEVSFDVKGKDVSMVDLKVIESILYQFIHNSFKFTLKGFIKIRMYVSDHKLSCLFIDSGVGIAQNDLTRIFVPFKQSDDGLSRRFEGLGIGLSIVKSYVDLLDGKCKVKSKMGQGTIFWISFPIKPLPKNKLHNLDI